MDILENARKKIVAERVELVDRPPSDFSKPYDSKKGVLWGGALGGLGALVGAHTGIAVLGTAVSGAWVLAPILGVAGLAMGNSSKTKH